MRHVIETNEYKRCLRRAGKSIYSWLLEEELPSVIYALANDEPLDPKYRDHPLHGIWKGSRDCHIKPDFVLVYTYLGNEFLRLERLGTHAEIFGL